MVPSGSGSVFGNSSVPAYLPEQIGSRRHSNGSPGGLTPAPIGRLPRTLTNGGASTSQVGPIGVTTPYSGKVDDLSRGMTSSGEDVDQNETMLAPDGTERNFGHKPGPDGSLFKNDGHGHVVWADNNKKVSAAQFKAMPQSEQEKVVAAAGIPVSDLPQLRQKVASATPAVMNEAKANAWADRYTANLHGRPVPQSMQDVINKIREAHKAAQHPAPAPTSNTPHSPAPAAVPPTTTAPHAPAPPTVPPTTTAPHAPAPPAVPPTTTAPHSPAPTAVPPTTTVPTGQTRSPGAPATGATERNDTLHFLDFWRRRLPGANAPSDWGDSITKDQFLSKASHPELWDKMPKRADGKLYQEDLKNYLGVTD